MVSATKCMRSVCAAPVCATAGAAVRQFVPQHGTGAARPRRWWTARPRDGCGDRGRVGALAATVRGLKLAPRVQEVT